MTRASIQSASIVLLTILLALVMSMDIINYKVLAEDIANGMTYILYPGLFTPTVWTILILFSLLLLINKGDMTLRHTIIWIIFLWPMIMALNFLAYGYVLSLDQPRLEFALGSLIVGGKVTLDQALKISSYFNWPSTWLLEGMFSSITSLSPFEAPIYLMVVTHLLLGLALIIVSRKIFPVYDLAIVSLLAYTILNAYKVLHFCPQIYALTLFTLLLTLLFKESSVMGDPILRFILSAAIITSHPLTSLAIAGIACSTLLFSLTEKVRKSYSMPVFGIITLVLLISWNINYENFVKSLITEVLSEPQIQPLPPIAMAKIYDVDMFYKLMVFYRYLLLTILCACSLLAIIVLLKHNASLRMKLLAIGTGIFIGMILLNFIPGSFFHRLLYYACALMSALIPIVALSTKKKLRVNKSVKAILILIILLLPLLSHVTLLEFLTNNSIMITGPHEISSAMFIAWHYDFKGCVGVSAPIGAVSFYSGMLKYHAIINTLCIQSMGYRISRTSILPLDYNLAGKFVSFVYVGEIFIVSPRERFIYYMNTAFSDFRLIDVYLKNNFHRIYDNGILKVMSKMML